MRMRSVSLVRSGDALVVLGGEGGTMQEVVTAYTEGKPVYLLTGRGYSSDKLEGLSPHLDSRRSGYIKVFRDPIEMAEALVRDLI